MELLVQSMDDGYPMRSLSRQVGSHFAYTYFESLLTSVLTWVEYTHITN